MAYVGAPAAAAGCVFCQAIESHNDRGALVLARGEHAFLILNSFPYAPGHAMAVLNRHIGSLADATPDELADTLRLAQRCSEALASEYRAEGFNIGLNQGRAAGAGIADHLHVHVVPRWGGDTNFVTVLGELRVLPEALEVTWDRLRGRLRA